MKDKCRGKVRNAMGQVDKVTNRTLLGQIIRAEGRIKCRQTVEHTPEAANFNTERRFHDYYYYYHNSLVQKRMYSTLS